ncbi:MAG: FAD-dependent oxidoreductase [Desulfuromonadaceae bacterium]|nr:FAD-dependent oxidoreductase [Desulfuromonadaceae bacterium]
MLESLWLKENKSPGFTSTKRKADVIVIGAGLTGLTTAWRLCQEGLDVIVLEASEVGSGTSGHTTGKITSQHRCIYDYLIKEVGEEKASLYAQANQWAVGEYRQLINNENIVCNLQEQKAHVYTHEEKNAEVLEREHAAAVKIGLPSSLESMPFSSNKVMTFSGQAQFNPQQFLLGLATKIIEHGGTIIEHTRVTKVEEKSLCAVYAENELFESGSVVYATLFPILDHSFFALRLRPVMHHGMAFSVKEQKFEGMFIGVDDISYRYYGNILIVVGGLHSYGDGTNPYETLERTVRKRFCVDTELARWLAHDQQSPDRIPFIGAYDPLTKKQYTATGFDAWGITHAMVAARIITDKIVARENPWEELYTPWRTGKTLSMAAKKAKDTFTSLIKGKHLCSHMGCGLVYNAYDETYDCPCHGSRFDLEGNILWGPAVKKVSAIKKPE